MDYKLIALDIDGTLTNSQKEITPRTRYALMEAQKQGKKIILASGRHPVGIMPIAKDLMLDRFGGFIMAFNGGRIINCETGETMVSKLFPLEYLPDIVNVLKDSNITINTYDDRRIISDNKVNDYTYVERDVIKAEMVVVDDFISSVRLISTKFFLQANPMSLISIRKFLQTVMTACSMYIKAHLIFLRLCRLVLQKAQCFRFCLINSRLKGRACRFRRQLQRYDNDRLCRLRRCNGECRNRCKEDCRLHLRIKR